MSDDVPNLRGGIPGWILALLGLLGGALGAGIPVIATIARMPDGPAWNQMRDDMASVKQKIAVMEANQAGAAKVSDTHNQLIDYKLDQLLTKKGTR